jgi:hypothetical protein
MLHKDSFVIIPISMDVEDIASYDREIDKLSSFAHGLGKVQRHFQVEDLIKVGSLYAS